MKLPIIIWILAILVLYKITKEYGLILAFITCYIVNLINAFVSGNFQLLTLIIAIPISLIESILITFFSAKSDNIFSYCMKFILGIGLIVGIVFLYIWYKENVGDLNLIQKANNEEIVEDEDALIIAEEIAKDNNSNIQDKGYYIIGEQITFNNTHNINLSLIMNQDTLLYSNSSLYIPPNNYTCIWIQYYINASLSITNTPELSLENSDFQKRFHPISTFKDSQNIEHYVNEFFTSFDSEANYALFEVPKNLIGNKKWFIRLTSPKPISDDKYLVYRYNYDF